MLYWLVLVFIDIALYYVSLFIGYHIRKFLGGFLPLPEFLIPMEFVSFQLWIPAIFILGFIYNGLYTKKRDYWDDLSYILKAFAISVILVFSVISFIKFSERLSRLHLLLSFMAYLFLYSSGRYYIKVFLNRAGIGIERTLIVGINDNTLYLARLIEKDRYLSYRIIGFWEKGYNAEGIEIGNTRYEVFKDDPVEDLIKGLRISSAIISNSYSEDIDLINRLRRYCKNIFFLPEKGLFSYESFLFSTLYSDSLVLSIKNNLRDPFNIFIKRLFDIGICIILLPLILPLMALIFILIRLDSPGRAIFTQERIGRKGRKIKVYKFRTMYINSDEILNRYLEENPQAKIEWERYFKLKGFDPRVTRIGRFLRKTSLDEIPQIFNVIKGDMSIIGPRPVTEEEIEKYYKDLSDFYYEVRPGITGLWQVSGRSDIDYQRRVFLDAIYAINWSLWLDIVILLKTIKVVLKREGAY